MSNAFKKFYTVALALIIALTSTVQMTASADEREIYMNEAGTYGVEVNYEKIDEERVKVMLSEVKTELTQDYTLLGIIAEVEEFPDEEFSYIIEGNREVDFTVNYENDKEEMESFDFKLDVVVKSEEEEAKELEALKDTVDVYFPETGEIRKMHVDDAVETENGEETTVGSEASKLPEVIEPMSEEIRKEFENGATVEEVEEKVRAASAIMSAPMTRSTYHVTVEDIGTGTVGAGITPPGGSWTFNMGWPGGMPKIIVDGQIAYCIEPLTSPARTENAKKYSIDSIDRLGLGPNSQRTLEFTPAKKRAVQLAAAYGHGYPGRTGNAWIWATQRAIWEEIGWEVFADDIPASWDQSGKVAQIKADIRNHDKKPAWAGKHMEANDTGHVFVLDDSLLNTYEIKNSKNLRIVSHSGNTLRVRIDNPAEKASITMSKKSATRKGSGSAVFTDGSSQKVIVGENPFDVEFNATFEVKGGVANVEKRTEAGTPLSDVVFEISKDKKTVIETIKSDSRGFAKSSVLPHGEYFVREKSAPAPFVVDREWRPITIKPGEETRFNIANYEQRSDVIVTKVENDWDKIQTQFNGQALAGAEIELFAAEDIKVAGKLVYSKGDSVGVQVSDKDGKAVFEKLPLGKYYAVENKAPEGFQLFKGRWEVEAKFAADKNDVPVIETHAKATNQPIYGKARLVKHDEKWTLLEGATFGVFTKEGEKLMELKSNFAGRIVTPELRYGEYYFQEIEAPEGYWLDSTKIPFTISEQDEIVELTAPNYTIKARLLVNKTDAETGEPLAGAKFKIWDLQANDWVSIKYADGMNVIEKDEWITDENGQFLMEATIPYGKYQLVETEAPEGFIVHDPIDIDINDSQNYIELEVIGIVLPTDVGNDPIRSDIKVLKVDKNTGEALPGFKFKLTNMETEEEFILESDENGYADFGSHRYGMYMVEEIEVGGEYLIDKTPQFINITEHDTVYEVTFENEQPVGELVLTKVDFKDGTPVADAEYGLFDLNDELVQKEVTDEEGKIVFKDIPLGKYYVKELVSPKEYVLDENEYHVSVEYIDDVTPVIHLEQEVKEWRVPEIGTTAAFVEREKEEPNIVTLVDEVRYENLVPGREYVVEGHLMNKETNEPIIIDGEKVTGRTEFVAETIDGMVEVFFTFDQNKLKTDTVVVFEDLYEDEILIAVHHDINDEGQTVEIPEIGTTASFVEVDKKEPNIATIVDEVRYEGLVVGEKYEVTGVLMDKETEEPIIIDGEKVTGRTEFVAEKSSGMVEVEFTLDLNELETDTVVVFEDLYNGERLIAVHHDINDEEQTVEIPNVGTKASYVGLDKKEPNMVTLVDEVHYENLIVGKEYTVDGFLMDKETNEPVLIDGKKVEGSTTFVAKEASGMVEVEFRFDVNKLKTDTVVVFEDLYDGDRLIAVHHDINDEDQTVEIPRVGTTASLTDVNEETNMVTIVDEVRYENLIPGKKYTVTGKLMDKETGKPIIIDGKEVTGRTEFVAEKSSGMVEVEFTFDRSKLKIDTVVVFEDLYDGDRLIAVHHDINDVDQTVKIPQPAIPTGDAQGALIVSVGLILLASAKVLIDRKRKLTE